MGQDWHKSANPRQAAPWLGKYSLDVFARTQRQQDRRPIAAADVLSTTSAACEGNDHHGHLPRPVRMKKAANNAVG